MTLLDAWGLGLAAMALAAVGVWVLSLIRNDVSIVDSLWSLMFFLGAVVYAVSLAEPGPRTALVLFLCAVWAIRLSAYITWRGWGEPEDRRYQAIRAKHQPFGFKSLYIVFLFQALLAWFVSQPLLAAMAGAAPLGILDYAGVALWAIGLGFEGLGDFQLARFKSNPDNKGKVMSAGLWHYTRHPNYFGDFCVWWGFYLIALGAGGWWSVTGPLVMSFLLMRVSGVVLLEKDLTARHPAYQEYIRRTNAFFPGVPAERSASTATDTNKG